MKKFTGLFLAIAICVSAIGAPMEFRPATLDEAIEQMTAKGFGTIAVDQIIGITTAYSKTIKKDEGIYTIELTKTSQSSASVSIEASTKRGHAVDYNTAQLEAKLEVLGFVEEKEGSWKLDAGAITGNATFGEFAQNIWDDKATIKSLYIGFNYAEKKETVSLWE